MIRKVNFVVFGWIAAMLTTFSACTHTPQAPASAVSKPEFTVTDKQPRVADEYLVTLAPDADKSIISDYYGRFGIKDIYTLGDETYLLVLVNDPGPQKMVALVNEDSRVLAVQPNLVYWNYRSGSIKK